MDQQQEREIINRVLAGERSAFALLVDAYKKPVFNLAFRMTGSYSDADDLTQETFIRTYQQLARFQQDKKFFTWIYTISLNLIRNHLKKKAKEIPTLANDDFNIERVDPDQNKESNKEEEMLRLEQALLMLSVDIREAIILKFNSDLTFDEIAAVSGDSVSAVKMRIYRGLEKLKTLMEKEK